MPTQFTYDLTYAGIPFLLDAAKVVKFPFQHSEYKDQEQLPPKKHQSYCDLIDELDRMLSFKYLQDFLLPPSYPGRNLGAVAYPLSVGPMPSTEVKIGDWYYPNGANRFSVFRGLASSSQAKAMLAATRGISPKTFKFQTVPAGEQIKDDYLLESLLYMLPPRPLAEHGGKFDGLYLITLVDERYYWQYTPVSLRVTQDSTWSSLIQDLATVLNVTINFSTVATSYSAPEIDSHLWTNSENAAILLDAVAYNVGRSVVRALDGTYTLETFVESENSVKTSRGNARTVKRTAGGDIFSSGTKLKVGNLQAAKNSVVPSTVRVTFPKYVFGDDPVPHFMNPRYQNQRPSCWFEEGYGDLYSISVPIQSGGTVASGLSGISTHTIHSTAKALLSGENQLVPLNSSGLTSLAMQVANDFYASQISVALDEVYAGSYAWTPEGIHDIVWSWSAREKKGTTRVLKVEWNQVIREMQHTTPQIPGFTSVPKGVGGPSVAQTWRDTLNEENTLITTLSGQLLSGVMTASLVATDDAPHNNRWRASIGDEVVLFEGTSGNASLVDIAYRAIDGTFPATHAAGTAVEQTFPSVAYGINLVTPEHPFEIWPGAWTSGGISEVRLKLKSGGIGSGFLGSGSVTPGTIASGAVTSGTIASGAVNSGNISSGSIGNYPIASGAIGSGALASGAIQSGTLFWWMFGTCLSGVLCSGSVQWFHLGSGSVLSGHIGSGQIASGHISPGYTQNLFVNIGQSDHTFLAADVAISGSTFSGVGLTLNLPNSGRIYEVTADVVGFLNTSVGTPKIIAKLRNITDGVDIDGSDTVVVQSTAVLTQFANTASITRLIYISGDNKTIEVTASIQDAGIPVAGNTGIGGSATFGYSRLNYTRV